MTEENTEIQTIHFSQLSVNDIITTETGERYLVIRQGKTAVPVSEEENAPKKSIPVVLTVSLNGKKGFSFTEESLEGVEVNRYGGFLRVSHNVSQVVEG